MFTGVILTGWLTSAPPAQAQQDPQSSGAPAPQSPIPGPSEEAKAKPGPIWQGGLFERGNLLGSIGGLRDTLSTYGVSLGLQETVEIFGNLTGGVKTNAVLSGAALLSLGVDTEKAVGWKGGTFNVSAWQIHGRNFTPENAGVIQTVTGLEATPATRLWELWYQQSFLDGAADVKIGQQSIDLEFMTSTYSGLFLNAAMGFPVLPAVDLYAGGPAYPLSSLGVRFRAQPTESITFLAGVFNDNPPGGPFYDDSQVRGAERSGTRFNLNTGALFIAELQYAINQPTASGDDAAAGSRGLPGTYKIGAWFDSANFPDQRFDTAGLSLADPASTGDPAFRRHNWSIYGVIDQMVWRPDPDGPRSVGVFARAMGAPGDRNLVNFSFNAGVTMKAPLPGRDDDSVGVGVGLAHISPSAHRADSDVAFYSGNTYSRRSNETFVELTYQYQVAPWMQVQPDFQYFFRPGGGVPHPDKPEQRIGNEAILGLRTNIVF